MKVLNFRSNILAGKFPVVFFETLLYSCLAHLPIFPCLSVPVASIPSTALMNNDVNIGSVSARSMFIKMSYSSDDRKLFSELASIC